ncbi:endonuclease/exonuclease/phosphatase family protein [Staphylococcus agnetis]|uniref:endonuclease/exonuclease/phosphatase family protein n=1 Tax=Staphylococcus agnetis TaxID=985762 RepID=UPI000D1BF68E|nr:endonuclease/exonuclease/phosphatase family protein [Staphylococcus agnetis]NJH86214.1 endonuclease [Staphylococcus agnetis]NJI15031.1 endonuclease [Staphylococcus agnetis]PTH42321.1 endonuclease [Staphylococcus agnetis]
MVKKLFVSCLSIGLISSTIALTPIDAHTSTKLQIHDIQGDTYVSKYANQHVDGVEGIVTFQYTLNGQHYFHLQTPDHLADNNPNTSEGIIVFAGKEKPRVKVGDAVEVSGLVSEYPIEGYKEKQKTDQPLTEIDARYSKQGKIKVIRNNQPLPKPIKIKRVPSKIASTDGRFNPKKYALDYWESLEGMRVQVDNVRSVGPQEHGDIFTVNDNVRKETIRDGILLKERSANGQRIPFKVHGPLQQTRNFDVSTGDQFKGPLIGYVNYGYQNYKINIDYDTMKKAHVKGPAQPQGTSLTPSKDKLTMASYNLENFSNNPNSTTDDKAQKLAHGIVSHMKNPDIVGVTEVQDNDGPGVGGPEANESYQRLIDAIKADGGPTYAFKSIDPEMNQDGGQPNANIRVGFLYRPDRVSFNKNIKPGDAKTSVSYRDGHLSHNPGRIAPSNPAFNNSRKTLAAEFTFKGKQIIAIVNHWNSKNGDDPLFGKKQPAERRSEIQRVQMAKAVGEFVQHVQSQNPKANIISVGDYNDFQWSQALKTFEQYQMVNLVNSVPSTSRYSYNYQGNAQTLDHVFVSKHLKSRSKLDMIHVNSDFTDMSGRASDHDPLLAQIDFSNNKR